MDNLKNNKKTIIICLFLLSAVGIISYFVSNKRFNSNEIVYEELIEKYEANQFIPVYVTESDMANKYLNDFKNLMLYDLESAYNVINKKYREKKYDSLDIFKKNIQDEYSKLFYSMSVKEYSVINKGDYKYFYIRDTRDNLYIFKELSIMNYEVFLDDYTVEVK